MVDCVHGGNDGEELKDVRVTEENPCGRTVESPAAPTEDCVRESTTTVDHGKDAVNPTQMIVTKVVECREEPLVACASTDELLHDTTHVQSDRDSDATSQSLTAVQSTDACSTSGEPAASSPQTKQPDQAVNGESTLPEDQSETTRDVSPPNGRPKKRPMLHIASELERVDGEFNISRPRRTTTPRGEIFSIPTLFHFASSVGVTRVLERLVENALANNRPLDHILLHGPPGSGTTLVARAIVRDLAPKNFVELDLLDGVDQDTLRRALREVRNQGVLLIRHIELLSGANEQFLMSCIARKTVRGTGSFARETPPSTEGVAKQKRPMDEYVADAVRRPPLRIDGNFTLIGTAHLTQQIGYQLRGRFDHMIHLRSDPVGIRIAMRHALSRFGLTLDESAHRPIERFVRTIDDIAEQFVQAIVMRAQLEETCHLNDTIIQTVVADDMPGRIADEIYAWALVRHLAGRRVTSVTDNEVERLESETGWGEIAVRAALGLVVRNQATRAIPPAA